jgi:hypothetical protein
VVTGELQGEKPAPSSRHSKLAPTSLEKVKVGVALSVGPAGPESIEVSGAVVSVGVLVATVKLRDAGVPSVLSAASVART